LSILSELHFALSFSTSFFSMIPLPPRTTLFPYTTLFRSKPFLVKWGYGKNKIKQSLANNLVVGIQYCINNLLYYKSELSVAEKKKYINEILQHKETKKYIDHYQPCSTSDQLYKKLIKYRLSSVIMYIKSWKKAA